MASFDFPDHENFSREIEEIMEEMNFPDHEDFSREIEEIMEEMDFVEALLNYEEDSSVEESEADEDAEGYRYDNGELEGYDEDWSDDDFDGEGHDEDWSDEEEDDGYEEDYPVFPVEMPDALGRAMAPEVYEDYVRMVIENDGDPELAPIDLWRAESIEDIIEELNEEYGGEDWGGEEWRINCVCDYEDLYANHGMCLCGAADEDWSDDEEEWEDWIDEDEGFCENYEEDSEDDE